ncbi:MAG: PAS domain-containing protein [Campylobacterales bacterium]
MQQKKLALFVSVVTFIAVFSIVLVIDANTQKQQQELLRQAASEKISTLQVSLEKHINSRVLLTQGLIAYVGINPEISPADFARYAGELYRTAEGKLLAIQLAKNSRISHIYPPEGHEKAMGINLAERPEQQEAINRAIRLNRVLLAGPIKLMQGGEAFISRGPVLLSEAQQQAGYPRYWGLAQVMLDAEAIYEILRNFADTASLELYLAGRDSAGAGGAGIYGDSALLAGHPVWADVQLPGGSWRLYAVPKTGWIQAVSWSQRIVGFALALLSAVLIGLLLYAPVKLQNMVRKATESLRKNEERWELAIEAADDGVWDWAIAQKKMHASPRWKGILGYGNEEIGEGEGEFFGRVHPDDLPSVRLGLQSHFKTPADRYAAEFRMAHKSGRYIWVRAFGKAVIDSSGKAYRMVGTLSDITEERERQALMTQHLKLAALGEMQGAIAHQWKQPLASLMMQLGKIRLEAKGGELARILADAEETVTFMGETVDDFNRFFLPGDKGGEFEPLRSIEEVVRMLSPRLKNHFVALKIEAGLSLPALEGNVNEFKQVALNLLSNAIEAVKEARRNGRLSETAEGVVRVDGFVANGTLHIRFEDNAGGIDPVILARLFTPYRSTKLKEGGSGFGLYLSQMIIETVFKGTLQAENGPHGAIFTVSIPLPQKEDFELKPEYDFSKGVRGRF